MVDVEPAIGLEPMTSNYEFDQGRPPRVSGCYRIDKYSDLVLLMLWRTQRVLPSAVGVAVKFPVRQHIATHQ